MAQSLCVVASWNQSCVIRHEKVLKFKMDDHPGKRYPVGSLVLIEKPMVFEINSAATVEVSYVTIEPGALMIIVGYTKGNAAPPISVQRPYDLFFRPNPKSWNNVDALKVWNVVGLIDGNRVESYNRFSGGDLLHFFTMMSDIRNAQEE